MKYDQVTYLNTPVVSQDGTVVIGTIPVVMLGNGSTTFNLILFKEIENHATEREMIYSLSYINTYEDGIEDALLEKFRSIFTKLNNALVKDKWQKGTTRGNEISGGEGEEQ